MPFFNLIKRNKTTIPGRQIFPVIGDVFPNNIVLLIRFDDNINYRIAVCVPDNFGAPLSPFGRRTFVA